MDTQYINKPGRYVCVVEAPQKGWLDYPEGKTPFIRIPCVVDMPENDQHGKVGIWIGYLGNKVSEKTGKTSRENTEAKLKEVFGWNGNWEDESSLDSFVGKKIRMQCDESEWQGKTQIKARWLNTLSTKSEKNKAEYQSKRKSVLEQLKKDYPNMNFAEPYSKTKDESGADIPF